MNPYEGLNLPQLLDLMHELVVPEPVSWVPSTPGWWVLAGWLMAVVLLSLREWLARRRRNRYRREALSTLGAIEADSPAAAGRIAELVKRTALSAYGRREVASLYGDAWAEFLARTAPGDKVVQSAAQELARAAWRDDTDTAKLSVAARRWISQHRVPGRG